MERLLLGSYLLIRSAEFVHIWNVCWQATGQVLVAGSAGFAFTTAVSVTVRAITRLDAADGRKWHWIQEFMLGCVVVLVDARLVALRYVGASGDLPTLAMWWIGSAFALLTVQYIFAIAGADVIRWNTGGTTKAPKPGEKGEPL